MKGMNFKICHAKHRGVDGNHYGWNPLTAEHQIILGFQSADEDCPQQRSRFADEVWGKECVGLANEAWACIEVGGVEKLGVIDQSYGPVAILGFELNEGAKTVFIG